MRLLFPVIAIVVLSLIIGMAVSQTASMEPVPVATSVIKGMTPHTTSDVFIEVLVSKEGMFPDSINVPVGNKVTLGIVSLDDDYTFFLDGFGDFQVFPYHQTLVEFQADQAGYLELLCSSQLCGSRERALQGWVIVE